MTENECDSCGKEPDFTLEDGIGYCAKCIIEQAEEILHAKKHPKVCPICNEKKKDLLLHLSTQHTKEEIERIENAKMEELG